MDPPVTTVEMYGATRHSGVAPSIRSTYTPSHQTLRALIAGNHVTVAQHARCMHSPCYSGYPFPMVPSTTVSAFKAGFPTSFTHHAVLARLMSGHVPPPFAMVVEGMTVIRSFTSDPMATTLPNRDVGAGNARPKSMESTEAAMNAFEEYVPRAAGVKRSGSPYAVVSSNGVMRSDVIEECVSSETIARDIASCETLGTDMAINLWDSPMFHCSGAPLDLNQSTLSFVRTISTLDNSTEVFKGLAAILEYVITTQWGVNVVRALVVCLEAICGVDGCTTAETRKFTEIVFTAIDRLVRIDAYTRVNIHASVRVLDKERDIVSVIPAPTASPSQFSVMFPDAASAIANTLRALPASVALDLVARDVGRGNPLIGYIPFVIAHTYLRELNAGDFDRLIRNFRRVSFSSEDPTTSETMRMFWLANHLHTTPVAPAVFVKSATVRPPSIESVEDTRTLIEYTHGTQGVHLVATLGMRAGARQMCGYGIHQRVGGGVLTKAPVEGHRTSVYHSPLLPEVHFRRFIFEYPAAIRAWNVRVHIDKSRTQPAPPPAELGDSYGISLPLVVTRDNMVASALEQITESMLLPWGTVPQNADTRTYLSRRQAHVVFAGEQGSDAGGPFHELFSAIVEEMATESKIPLWTGRPMMDKSARLVSPSGPAGTIAQISRAGLWARAVGRSPDPNNMDINIDPLSNAEISSVVYASMGVMRPRMRAAMRGMPINPAFAQMEGTDIRFFREDVTSKVSHRGDSANRLGWNDSWDRSLPLYAMSHIIRRGHVMDYRFPAAFYRACTGEAILENDFDVIYPEVARHLESLRHMSAEELESCDLTFEIAAATIPPCSLPLFRGGETMAVTRLNVDTYIRLYRHAKLISFRRNAIMEAAVHFGLVHFSSFSALGCTSESLRSVMHSDTAHDLSMLRDSMTYQGVTPETDASVIAFWAAYGSMSDDEKRKLIFFISGSQRLCKRDVNKRTFVMSKSAVESTLPIAHTCGRHLVIPPVTDVVEMLRRLRYAVEESSGYTFL